MGPAQYTCNKIKIRISVDMPRVTLLKEPSSQNLFLSYEPTLPYQFFVFVFVWVEGQGKGGAEKLFHPSLPAPQNKKTFFVKSQRKDPLLKQ